MQFKEWLQHQVDERQIDSIYDKGHIAVKIVNLYNSKILENITTIANLASGAYGLYNSGDSKKQLPPNTERWLVYNGINKDRIGLIPNIILNKWGVDPKSVKIGDTIHINVHRILNQSRSHYEAILQLASTIIHEATHSIERETTGTSSEDGPKRAEHQFMDWVGRNSAKLLQMFPELREAKS